MLAFSTIFVTLWLFAIACWWALASARESADVERIKERLLGQTRHKKSRKAAALISDGQKPKGKLLPRLLNKLKLRERAGLLIEQAGLKWNLERATQGSLALFLAGFAAVWYLAPALRAAAFGAGLLAGALPLLSVLRRRKRRLRAFEEQFPESLEFISRSMRAGHAFSVSLEMVHHEFKDPLAGEFRRTSEEHNLGLPLETALGKLGQRVPSMDVRFFVSAVVLQKRTGGNLAELLDKLAALIRERFKLRGRIRAVSAHGKITGGALSSIPIGVAVMMFVVNPEYFRFFALDPAGQLMMGGAVVLQLIGYVIIRQIVKIEV